MAITYDDDFHRRGREKFRRWYNKHKPPRKPIRKAMGEGALLFSIGNVYFGVARPSELPEVIARVFAVRDQLPNRLGEYLCGLDVPPTPQVLLSAGGNLPLADVICARNILMRDHHAPPIKIDPEGRVTVFPTMSAAGSNARRLQGRGRDREGNIWL